MDVPAYKVASFELVDLPLIEKMARTGKPIIMSTGMATLAEIDEAVRAARRGRRGRQIALLKCTTAYPAPPEEMNLRTIPHLAEAFGVPAGLSDHSMGIAVPVAAVALGASIIEKHLTHCPQRRRPGQRLFAGAATSSARWSTRSAWPSGPSGGCTTKSPHGKPWAARIAARCSWSRTSLPVNC